MGDIWPYGPPKYVSWAQAKAALEHEGMSPGNAVVGAAIGEAESSLDLTVINDTPSTGDYSVGVWQINYAGNLYVGRTHEFGTPEQLIRRGLPAQANACYQLWRQSGFRPWSTYNSGAYQRYLHGGSTSGGTPGAYGIALPPPNKPGKDSWSGQIKGAAGHIEGGAHTFANAGNAISILRR